MWKWMNFGMCFLMFVMVLFLGACSTADTTGSTTNREYDMQITNNGDGNILVYTPLSVTASTDQGTDQTTDNDPANTTSPSTSLGLNGGTSSLADKGGELLADGVSSALDRSYEDKSSTVATANSHNKTEMVETVEEEVQEEEHDSSESEPETVQE